MSLAVSIEEKIPGDFITRHDWGGPHDPGGTYRHPSNVEAMTGHITTGNNLGRSNTTRWVKNIYDYHTGSNGWSDIGYAFLFDRYGNVFEGRGIERWLAHAVGYNDIWLGTAYLGGVANEVTDRAKAAFLGLRQALKAYGLHVDHVNGHRDVSNKACPGDPFYSWIQAGLPAPKTIDMPGPGEPPDKGKPDFQVAVIAANDIDEGMGRVLGKAYQWKFLRANDLADLDGIKIGTAVRVGSAAQMKGGPWQDTHDIAGRDRDQTALLVKDRIRAREGSSRSVT